MGLAHIDQLVWTVMRDALGEPEPIMEGLLMKRIRKYRLVCACLYCLGGFFRLVAALVGMASNYPRTHGVEVGSQIRA